MGLASLGFRGMFLLIILNAVHVLCQEYPEQRLQDALLSGYGAKARPVANKDDIVNVTLALYLTKVVDLNSDTHILTTSGWVQAVWHDPRLVWDPIDFGGIEKTYLYAGDLWVPDFALENSAGNFYELAHTRSFKVGLNYTGRAEWEPGGMYETYCHMDVFYYPFDTQTCDMIFTSWGYDTKEVLFLISSNVIYHDEGFYQKSGAWKVSTGTARALKHQYVSMQEFSRVIFSLEINRVYLYYFVTMMFPAMVLSCLVLMVYAVPRNKGEKLSMGLTLMLSFFVFMLNMSNFVPRSAIVIPLFQIYLLFYMAITAITVGISVMMLWLNNAKHIQEPHAWLRFLVYRIMANVICYGACSKKPRFKYFGNEDEDDEYSVVNGSTIIKSKVPPGQNKKAAASLAASNLMELDKVSAEADDVQENIKRQGSTSLSDGLLDGIGRIRYRLKAIEQGTVDMMNVIWQSDNELDEKQLEQIKGEWREITSIINRFSFWVLFSFTVAFILMCTIFWIVKG